jgi:hypothetical protein
MMIDALQMNWIINFQIMSDECLGGGLSTLLGQCKCWGNIHLEVNVSLYYVLKKIDELFVYIPLEIKVWILGFKKI